MLETFTLIVPVSFIQVLKFVIALMKIKCLAFHINLLFKFISTKTIYYEHFYTERDLGRNNGYYMKKKYHLKAVLRKYWCSKSSLEISKWLFIAYWCNWHTLTLCLIMKQIAFACTWNRCIITNSAGTLEEAINVPHISMVFAQAHLPLKPLSCLQLTSVIANRR